MQELTTQESEELKQLAPDSAEIINREHAALLVDCKSSQDLARAAKDRALRIGAELKKVKEAAPGRYIAWVETNCSFCRRTASRYLALHEQIHGKDGTHVSHVSDDMTLRQAYVALDIIPPRPREQGKGNIYRGGGAPGVYDALFKLTAFLGAVDGTDAVPDWMTDGEERYAVQRQYAPKLEDFILRLFGKRVQLLSIES